MLDDIKTHDEEQWQHGQDYEPNNHNIVERVIDETEEKKKQEKLNLQNWLTGRYKTCGYGQPMLDENGHYDDVMCAYDKHSGKYRGQCGCITCPIDMYDSNEMINNYD